MIAFMILLFRVVIFGELLDEAAASVTAEGVLLSGDGIGTDIDSGSRPSARSFLHPVLLSCLLMNPSLDPS